MENQSQNTPVTAPSAASVPAAATPAASASAAKPAARAQKIVAPQKQPGQPRVAGSPKVSNDVFVRKIVDKIKESENILVALSRDPSVDEIAAAIGLTLFLDSLQKHTTAIYSGQAPGALQFLQPEGTFETNTDSLQDFIIALNKEKADHLRYKLDGDFVKVYITPYKATITEDDLEFSHGDYNVNLVLAIGVPSAADLDSALSEHGRIMHDATTVDITIDAPGKFAEIEWSDPGASSVSEMVTKLIFAMQGQDAVLDKEMATALLTGIVAATGRFSNDRTNSETMQLASKLMAMGADQQLISAHVADNDSDAYRAEETKARTDLAVAHDETVEVNDGNGVAIAMEGAVVTPVVEPAQAQATQASQMDGVSQAEVAAAASAAVNEAVAAAAANAAAVGAVSPAPVAPASTSAQPIITGVGANRVVQQQAAPSMMNPIVPASEKKDYAQMLEQALAEPAPGEAAVPAASNGAGAPSAAMNQVSNVATGQVSDGTRDSVSDGAGDLATQASAPAMSPATSTTMMNPAAQAAPVEAATSGPEPVAKPSGVTLPPPPAPVPTADMMPPMPPKTLSAANGTSATTSGAFQIPGMK